MDISRLLAVGSRVRVQAFQRELHEDAEVLAVEVVGVLNGELICTVQNLVSGGIVRELAARIEQEEGTPRLQQRLLSSGRRLWDSETLASLTDTRVLRGERSASARTARVGLLRLGAEVAEWHLRLMSRTVTLRDVPEQYASQQDILLSAIYGSEGDAFSMAPDHLQKNLHFIVDALRATPNRSYDEVKKVCSHIPSQLLSNKKALLTMMDISCRVLAMAPVTLQADPEFALCAIKITGGKALLHVARSLQRNRLFVSRAVRATSGRALQYALVQFQEDPDMEREAEHARLFAKPQIDSRHVRDQHGVMKFAPLARSTPSAGGQPRMNIRSPVRNAHKFEKSADRLHPQMARAASRMSRSKSCMLTNRAESGGASS